MPPKEIANLSVGFINESGEFKEISAEPLTFSDISCGSDNDYVIRPGETYELSFDLRPGNGLTFNDMYLCMFCGFDIDKVKQNNWRKIHGIPMKRRRKCRV